MNNKLNTGEVYKKDWWQREAFNRFKPLIEKSIDVSKITNILDLGCGNGIVTEYLSDIFPNASVLGIDVNSPMVSSAKINCTKDNVRFDVLDIKNLEALFDEGIKYDLVNANYVLHWLSLDEKHQLFDKLQKITVPNAVYMIGTCQSFPNFLQALDDEIRKYFDISPETPGYLHYLTQQGWEELLQAFGISVEGVYKSLDVHPILLSEDKMDPENFLCSWLWGASAGRAAYMHSPENFSPSFIKSVINELLKYYATAEYYREAPKGTNCYKTAAFLEETLFVLGKK